MYKLDTRQHKMFTLTTKISSIPLRTWWMMKLDFASNVIFLPFGKTEIFCAPTLPALFRHQRSLGLSLCLLNQGDVQYLTSPVPGQSLLAPFSVFTSFLYRSLTSFLTWLLSSMDRRGKINPQPICNSGLSCNVFTATHAGFLLVYPLLGGVSVSGGRNLR